MSNAASSNRFQRGACSFVGSLLLACCSLGVATVSAEDPELTLRFKGGGYVSGTLLPSDQPGGLRVQCSTFEEPLEFDIEALSSIEVNDAVARESVAEQRFFLANGTTLAGTLTELDETSIVVDSACLGIVRLPRTTLQYFISNSGLGKLIYTGPRGTDEWYGTANKTDWKHEAGALFTSESGTTAVGDIELPEKCEVRIALAWSATPSFTLSIGCSRPTQPTDRIVAAASLEIWNGQLMMVREGNEEADIAALPDLLSDRTRMELTIYLDQKKGVFAVGTPGGQLLGKLQIEDKNPTPKRFIALSNHADREPQMELRLERCEVRQWDGLLPMEWPTDDRAVLLSDGQALPAKLGTLAAGQTQITIIDKEGKASAVPLKSIQHAVVSASTEADEPSAESIRVELIDGCRLVGKWAQMDSGKVTFTLDKVAEPVSFLLSDVVRVLGNAERYRPPELSGKIGQLQSEAALLKGCLADSEGVGVLRWHPLGASAPSRLATASSGKIEYQAPRSPKPAALNRSGVRLRAGPGVGVVVNGWGVAEQRPLPTRKALEPGLKLRRGDELPAKVERIDEHGVTFHSSETSVTFLPNKEIEAVILATRRAANTQTPEKLKRLMTVPRSSKNDPPTHLLISVDEDYLRGRLVELDDKRAIMEVRLEEVELPTDRIAEIHWLHSRDWQEGKSDKSQQDSATAESAEDVRLHVHILRENDRSITFVPNAFSAQTLQGENDLLGTCKVELANVTTVRFGADLTKSAQLASEETWKLSLATLPKVYQESEGGPGDNRSPLVGKPASDFVLDTVSGQKFQLQKLRGRVVVLDFWASWCGPCLQTMPEVDRIINEVGGDRVDWVAINLQETKERAQATIGRLGLSPIVVLDQDGLVAQQYQATAIPQTVIIDRQGNVTHLFIGGGQRFFKEFEEALTSVLDAP